MTAPRPLRNPGDDRQAEWLLPWQKPGRKRRTVKQWFRDLFDETEDRIGPGTEEDGW